MSAGESFFKNSIAMQISREMALDFGLVEATEAEKQQRAAEMDAWRARKAAARPGILAALSELEALTGIERAILDLHSQKPHKYGFGHCEGCDYSGWESEPPDWPCRTVELIANAHGIDVSNFHLYEPRGDDA